VTRTTLPFARILDPALDRAPKDALDRRKTPQEAAYRAAAGEVGVDDRSALTPAERDSVLEIALLMATANGSTSPDELSSLADLVAHLEGARPAPGQLSTKMNAIEKRGIGGTVEERVRAIAATLQRRLPRELAYKAAYAIRVSDLESNPDEEDLADLLIEVLALDDLAADLENEVNEALMG
jgi:tellurite resistance protein